MTGLSLLLSGAVACSSTSSGMGVGEGEEGARSISDSEIALNEREWGDGSIPGAQEDGIFKDVRFEYNSSTVTPYYQAIIRDGAKVLKADDSLRVEIEGHCDNRGTNEYNMALGEQRAKSVANLLLNYGARPDQLSWISYGEEIPLESAENEDAYAKNRRAHFVLYRENAQRGRYRQ